MRGLPGGELSDAAHRAAAGSPSDSGGGGGGTATAGCTSAGDERDTELGIAGNGEWLITGEYPIGEGCC